MIPKVKKMEKLNKVEALEIVKSVVVDGLEGSTSVFTDTNDYLLDYSCYNLKEYIKYDLLPSCNCKIDLSEYEELKEEDLYNLIDDIKNIIDEEVKENYNKWLYDIEQELKNIQNSEELASYLIKKINKKNLLYVASELSSKCTYYDDFKEIEGIQEVYSNVEIKGVNCLSGNPVTFDFNIEINLIAVKNEEEEFDHEVLSIEFNN